MTRIVFGGVPGWLDAQPTVARRKQRNPMRKATVGKYRNLGCFNFRSDL
jgi:hypothetical protein